MYSELYFIHRYLLPLFHDEEVSVYNGEYRNEEHLSLEWSEITRQITHDMWKLFAILDTQTSANLAHGDPTVVYRKGLPSLN